MHQTIRKVTEDIGQRYHLNTAVSSIMEFFNLIRRKREELRKSEEGKSLLKETMQSLILLLYPFAPHICEELWERMGNQEFLIRTPWPAFDPRLAIAEKVIIVVQVNGKLRDRFETERDSDEEEMKIRALRLSRIQNFIGGKDVKKVIYIKNKLVNIVV